MRLDQDDKSKALAAAKFSTKEQSDINDACKVITNMQIETKLFVEENDEEFEDIPDDEEKSEIPPEIAAIKAKEAEISGDDIYENDLVTLRVTLTRANVLEGDQAPPVHAVHMPKPLRESWWVILTDPTAPDGKGNIHAIEKIQDKLAGLSESVSTLKRALFYMAIFLYPVLNLRIFQVFVCMDVSGVRYLRCDYRCVPQNGRTFVVQAHTTQG